MTGHTNISAVGTNGTTVIKDALATEILFNRLSPVVPTLSTGRNGNMQTIGVYLRYHGRHLDIMPINSRNNIGRACVSMPNDLDHLKALRDSLTAIIDDKESGRDIGPISIDDKDDCVQTGNI